jgi:hypothetical protein
MAPHEEDDIYDDIPLQLKKAFGSSLKVKRVPFVKASDGDLASTHTNAGLSGKTVSDLYLSVVMKNTDARATSSEASTRNTPFERRDSPTAELKPPQEMCADCKLPFPRHNDEVGTDTPLTKRRKITAKHDASIAHQVSLAHSHPPSAIDRRRMGLAYLESCGWDPDSRKGLGVDGQGIAHPLKPKPKDNNLGIGLEIPSGVLQQAKKEREGKENDRVKKRKLKDKLKAEEHRNQRLHDLFYAKDDVLKYLGSHFEPRVYGVGDSEL